MKNWRTRKGLYEIHERSKKEEKAYRLVMTGSEISQWCKAKNDAYGYIPGIGGDRSYYCLAWLVQYID